MSTHEFVTPSVDDLKQRIRFSYETGHVWLGEQRMLLMHSEAMGSLRKELVETVGIERAKGIIMRTGFQAGVADAKLARQLRPDASDEEQFFVGPQLHQLEGFVRVTPLKFKMDLINKRFHMKLQWGSSYESEEHIKAFGHSKESACWMEIGYASGYTSEYTGQSILFVEQECRACGHDVCVSEGKPIAEWENPEELIKYYESDSIVDQILDLRDEVVTLRTSLVEEGEKNCKVIGSSVQIKEALALLAKASQGPVTVLLLGETGVGKELFARSLHRRGDRESQPFIAVNCAAIPEDLLEAELFGVDKGAYTGAHQSREGRFERANGGTLFLDEIGDLSYSAQAKLLRVLQEGELERVGGTNIINVDVRVVAATHADLLEKVEKGSFRRDLYYRLNVFPIKIPALRERPSDIALLVESFIARYKVKYRKEVIGITQHAMAQLEAHPWPGNIRELENVIERGVLLCDDGKKIELKHLFAMMPVDQVSGISVSQDGGLKDAKKGVYNQFVDMFFDAQNNLFEIEQTILKEALNRSKGNMSKAARVLGMTRPQLAYRIGKLEEKK